MSGAIYCFLKVRKCEKGNDFVSCNDERILKTNGLFKCSIVIINEVMRVQSLGRLKLINDLPCLT